MPMEKFNFIKVTGSQPATLLKVNFIMAIFQIF